MINLRGKLDGFRRVIWLFQKHGRKKFKSKKLIHSPMEEAKLIYSWRFKAELSRA